MPTALVTRPREDAEGIAAALRERGFEVIVEPLLTIVPRQGVELPLDGVQAALITSANGVRALAGLLPGRSLKLLTVGEASARAARDLGFADVVSAGGDVHTLAALARDQLAPRDGALLHPSGTEVAGDLAALLAGDGFEVRRVPIYEARIAEALSDGVQAALAGNVVDVSLFFSPRTAATFVNLVERAGLAAHCAAVSAYAISPAAARALESLPWRKLTAATVPDQRSLLAAVDGDRA